MVVLTISARPTTYLMFISADQITLRGNVGQSQSFSVKPFTHNYCLSTESGPTNLSLTITVESESSAAGFLSSSVKNFQPLCAPH